MLSSIEIAAAMLGSISINEKLAIGLLEKSNATAADAATELSVEDKIPFRQAYFEVKEGKHTFPIEKSIKSRKALGEPGNVKEDKKNCFSELKEYKKWFKGKKAQSEDVVNHLLEL